VPSARYKRVLLKLSGEILAGDQRYGIDPKMLDTVAESIGGMVDLGVETAIVIGGGNLFRGIAGSAAGVERVSADHMGMLATVINALALQNILEQKGIVTRVQSAIEMKSLAEGYIRRKAIRHLEKKRVVLFAAGTGNPYFSTDTAAVLRAMEVGAEIVLKGTKVDGVYDRDPLKYPGAVRFDTLTFFEVIEKGLEIMDSTAMTLAMDNNLRLMVFDVRATANIKRALLGEHVGTVITKSKPAP